MPRLTRIKALGAGNGKDAVVTSGWYGMPMAHDGTFDDLVRDAARMTQSSRAAMLSAAQSAEVRDLMGSLSAACRRGDRHAAGSIYNRITDIVRDGPPRFC